MNDNSKVLITGGLGCIGYNLTKQLKSMGCQDITIVDNYSGGSVNLEEGVRLDYLDISNTERVNNYFQSYRPDYIFHLAAHFANQNSVEHPLSDISSNVIGLVNLMESQKGNGNLKKIVYTSSSCIYGTVSDMNESANVCPIETPYAINKYVGELYLRYYAALYGMPTISGRIFNTYGPGELPGRYRNVIPNFIQKAMNNEDITITGTGEETRDFTYVSDTVDFLILLAKSDVTNGDVFNCGTGKETKIIDLAETIVRLTQSDSQIIFKKTRNWDHVKTRRSDISKSVSHLGYSPSASLEFGLEKTIEWIKSMN